MVESKTILMNNNKNSLDKIFDDLDIPYLPTNGTYPSKFFANGLQIYVKKEKPIERDVYFPLGYDNCISRLSKIITGSWGHKHWMLNNFVDANYWFQQIAGGILGFDDGFYYVNLGFQSPIIGATVLMKLRYINTECTYMFESWETVTPNSVLAPLICASAPNWKFENFNPKNLKIEFHADHIFGQNRKRILSALPPSMDESEALLWFSNELMKQIARAKQLPDYVQPHWYTTKQHVGYVLPLYHESKLVLTAAIEKKYSHHGQTEFYNIVTVLLPGWAYNNARILRKGMTLWMTEYAANSTESFQGQERNDQGVGVMEEPAK